MQSKADFLIGLGGFLISQFAGIAFLYLVFEQIPSMKNWSFEQMLFIYGFAQIPRGLNHLFTDNLWMVAWQMDALGELLIGIIMVVRAVQNGTVQLTPLKILFFLISIIAGAVIYTSVKLFFAATAFWFKDSMPFLNAAYEMADFAKYPIGIYAKPIQIILMTVLPFAFVAYIPSTFFSGKCKCVKDNRSGMRYCCTVLAGCLWVIPARIEKV